MMKIVLCFSKQLLLAVACFLVMLSTLVVPVYADDSGSCGDNVSWSLKNGVLTIAGEGKMVDYAERYFPHWYTDRDKIVEVVVKEGVTNIGNVAFFNCTNLKKVTLADSVTSIGDYAFLQCDSLETIKMSKNVKSIGDYAFKMCELLDSIRLYDGLESIGYEAFFNCRSLKSITVPSSVTTLEECAFTYCVNLLQATINANISSLPEWTFYGCDSLTSVTLSNTIEEAEHFAFYDCDNLTEVKSTAPEDVRKNLSEDIKEDVSNFTNVNSSDDSSSNHTISNPGTDVVQKEVTEDEDGVISGEITKNEDETLNLNIDVKLETEDGWSSVVDKVDEYLSLEGLLNNFEEKNTVNATVKVEGSPSVSADVINNLKGKDVILKVEGNGLYCEINMSKLDSNKTYDSFTLDYSLEEITSKSSILYSVVGEARAFYLKFTNTIDIPVTVKIPFGGDYNRNYASLYQKFGNTWDALQHVQMDGMGVASFYLSNYDQFTTYLIALNVEGVNSNLALIPENLYDDYGGLMDEHGNKYVITGYSSKLGITLKEFSIIVAIAFGAVVLIVGGTMFLIQRRKAAVERIRQEVMSDDYLKNYVQKSNKKKKAKKVKKKK